GTVIGTIAGFLGGVVDAILMRITDLFLAFPPLLLAIAFAALFEPSLTTSIIAISLGWWAWYARLARGQAVAIRNRNYILVAHSIGASKAAIMLRHIIPNILAP